MIYQWKTTGPVPAIPAQVAGEELERLRVRLNGRLERRDVVEAARSPDSPLHPAFEWDDARAGEMWRLEYAGHIIRHIDVVVEQADRPATPIRAFVSVKRDSDVSYTSVAHAMGDADLRAQVVAAAWRELEAWRQRHAELIEFARVFATIDQARPAR